MFHFRPNSHGGSRGRKEVRQNTRDRCLTSDGWVDTPVRLNWLGQKGCWRASGRKIVWSRAAEMSGRD